MAIGDVDDFSEDDGVGEEKEHYQLGGTKAIFERQQTNIFFSPYALSLGRRRCSKIAHDHPEHHN